MSDRAGRLRKLPLTAFRLSADEIRAGDAEATRLHITRNEFARRAYLQVLGILPPESSGLTPREQRDAVEPAPGDLTVEYDT